MLQLAKVTSQFGATSSTKCQARQSYCPLYFGNFGLLQGIKAEFVDIPMKLGTHFHLISNLVVQDICTLINHCPPELWTFELWQFWASSGTRTEMWIIFNFVDI